jgi:hypothetical protein
MSSPSQNSTDITFTLEYVMENLINLCASSEQNFCNKNSIFYDILSILTTMFGDIIPSDISSNLSSSCKDVMPIFCAIFIPILQRIVAVGCPQVCNNVLDDLFINKTILNVNICDIICSPCDPSTNAAKIAYVINMQIPQDIKTNYPLLFGTNGTFSFSNIYKFLQNICNIVSSSKIQNTIDNGNTKITMTFDNTQIVKLLQDLNIPSTTTTAKPVNYMLRANTIINSLKSTFQKLNKPKTSSIIWPILLIIGAVITIVISIIIYKNNNRK